MATNDNAGEQQFQAKIDEVKGQIEKLEAQLANLSSTVTNTGSEFREFQTKALEGDRSNWAIDALVHRASEAYLESRQFKYLMYVAMIVIVVALLTMGVGITTSYFQLDSLDARAEKAAQKIGDAEIRTEQRMVAAENRAVRETDRVISASANFRATIDDSLKGITAEVQGEADEAKTTIAGHVTTMGDLVQPATTDIRGHVTTVGDLVEPATTDIADHVIAVGGLVEPATTDISDHVTTVGNLVEPATTDISDHVTTVGNLVEPATKMIDRRVRSVEDAATTRLNATILKVNAMEMLVADNLPNSENLEQLKSADSDLGKIVIDWENRIAAVQREGGMLTLTNVWRFLDYGVLVFFAVVLGISAISICLSILAMNRSGKPQENAALP